MTYTTKLLGLTGKVGIDDIRWGDGTILDTYTVPSYAGLTRTMTKVPALFPEMASTIKGVWYVSNDPAILDHGDTDYSGSLAQVVDGLGVDYAHMVLPPGTYYFLDDYTIPANVVLEPMIGATISVATGKTVTLNCEVIAGPWTIFGGSGTVTGLRMAYGEWFGAVTNDDTVDSGAAFAKAVEAVRRRGAVIPQPDGVYYCSTTIVISEKPVYFGSPGQMQCVFVKNDDLNGPVIRVEECNRPRGIETDQGDAWYTLDSPSDQGPVLCGFVLEGNERGAIGHGIQFSGVNADVILRDVHIFNFLGAGILACDPYGDSGFDATNQAMWECIFDNVEVKNCGYWSGNRSTSFAAIEVGRNDNGASNHNNLILNEVTVAYPRWVGVRVLNRQPAADGNIHKLQFRHCFIHGNTSVIDSASKVVSNNVSFDAATNTISTADADWITNPVEVGQPVEVQNSVSNDGTYTVVSWTATTMVVNGPLVDEAAGAGPKAVQIKPSRKDPKGDWWLCMANLVEIGNMPGETANTGYIKPVYFEDCSIIQQEAKCSAVYVGPWKVSGGTEGCQIQWNRGNLEGGSERWGVRFYRAGSSEVGNIVCNTNGSQTNLIRIDGMAIQYELVTLGPVSGPLVLNADGWGPMIYFGSWTDGVTTYYGTQDDVYDTTVQCFLWTKDLDDALGTDTVPERTIVASWERQYIKTARWVSAYNGVAESDTQYVNFNIVLYNPSGVAIETATTTTKTVAGGGIGAISKHIPVTLNVPVTTADYVPRLSGIAFSVTKTGGTITPGGGDPKLPIGTLCIELSMWKYN